MKRGLIGFLLAGALFFSSCNKEEFFEEVDLNGNGSLEYVQGIGAREGYCLYYFDGSAEKDFRFSSDTNYIVKGLKNKPYNPHAWDFEGDSYPDVAYGISNRGVREDFWVENNGGTFSEPEKQGR